MSPPKKLNFVGKFLRYLMLSPQNVVQPISLLVKSFQRQVAVDELNWVRNY